MQRCGIGVDALRDLRTAGTDELRAEQTAISGVSGDADADGRRSRVVPLVVIRDRGVTVWCEACGSCFVVAEARASCNEVEDLHDLRAEAPGELRVAADRVLARDAALLVGGRAEREIRDTEEAVMSDHSVAGRPNVRQAGAHPIVDDHSAARARGCTGCGEKAGVGPYADDDEHHVSGAGERVTVSGSCNSDSSCVACDSFDARIGEDVDAVAGESVVYEGTEFGIEGGEVALAGLVGPTRAI